MRRWLVFGGVVCACAGPAGCSSTWEAVSSRRFKERPFHHTFGAAEDPLHVLRTSPEGGERAAAMSRLKEPLLNGGTQADQDEVVEHILGPAAATDPSPVVRAAAIDTLGRLKDPRAPRLLVAAYHQSGGWAPGSRPSAPAAGPASLPSELLLTSGKKPGEPNRLADRLGLTGPSGFPQDTAAMLRARCLDGLARTGLPEGVDLLVRVAEGQTVGNEEATDRDTRLAAVRGLATVRNRESVIALQKVLATETGKDTGLASRAHAGLIELTGRDLPADPQKWDEVVQAGAQVGPERSGLEKTVGRLTSAAQ